MPEEIFAKQKNLSYPKTTPFKNKFNGIIPNSVFGVYESIFKKIVTKKTKKSLKKMMKDQESVDEPIPSEFLNSEFTKYKADPKIHFNLKNMFGSSKEFSDYLDNFYLKDTPETFFDLSTFNKNNEILISSDPVYTSLTNDLKTKKKFLIMMFGSPGIGKSHFSRRFFSSFETIRNVKITRISSSHPQKD